MAKKEDKVIAKQGDQYIAIRDSYGFRDKYWVKGETFVADEGEEINEHFELNGGAA